MIINPVIKGKQPVIDTLSVTPSTSPQQITAPQGTDGYSPVNVSAVTSSIDANIVAGNIKNGVSILGVTGDYTGGAPSRYLEFEVSSDGTLIRGKPNSPINLNGVTALSGSYFFYNAYGEDTNITGAINLSSLKTISGERVCYYMFYRCTGITSVDLSSLTMVSGSYGCANMFQFCTGITSVDLSSLVAVTGQNGCNSIFQYCSNITSMNLSSLVTVTGSSGCYNMLNNCTNLSSVDISHLCKLETSSALSAFCYGCTSLTSLSFPNLAYTATNFNGSLGNMLGGVTGCTVHFPAEWQTTMSSWSNVTAGFGGTNTTVLFDLPSVTTLDLSHIITVETSQLLYQLGYNNYFPNITSVDLSNLTTVSGSYGCQSMFQNCTGLTSVDLSSLTTVSGTSGCSSMFYGCTGLTSVDLSSLTTVSGSYGCGYMFQGCTGLTSVDLSNLTTVSGQNGCQYMFYSCTSLTSLSFPSLSTVENAQVFSRMLEGVTGCTVHFPSNLSSYQFENYVNGSNTTVLYDLPSTGS